MAAYPIKIMRVYYKYYPGALDLTFIRVIYSPAFSRYPQVIFDPDEN
jgi:hypothetical protein